MRPVLAFLFFSSTCVPMIKVRYHFTYHPRHFYSTVKICNPSLLFSFIFQVQRTHTKIHNPVELMMALCTVRCLVNTTTSMLTKLRLSPTWAAQKCKNLSVSPRLLSGIVKVKKNNIYFFFKPTFVSFDIFLFTSLYLLTWLDFKKLRNFVLGIKFKSQQNELFFLN